MNDHRPWRHLYELAWEPLSDQAKHTISTTTYPVPKKSDSDYVHFTFSSHLKPDIDRYIEYVGHNPFGIIEYTDTYAKDYVKIEFGNQTPNELTDVIVNITVALVKLIVKGYSNADNLPE